MQLLNLKQLSHKHQAFTVDAIRALIIRGAENGLTGSGAVVRIGRRLYIDEAAFEKWLELRRRKVA